MNRLPPFDGLDDLLYPFRDAEKLARELGDLDYGDLDYAACRQRSGHR